MNTDLKIPTDNDVSPSNAAIFQNLRKKIGFVPNMYAMMGYSKNGLATFLNSQDAKTTLTNKEKEAVSLVVSQVNECEYCQSAHTYLGKHAGFTDEQMMEIRNGSASFNPNLDSMIALAHSMAENRGHVDQTLLDKFFSEGYTKETLVDLIILSRSNMSPIICMVQRRSTLIGHLLPALSGYRKMN